MDISIDIDMGALERALSPDAIRRGRRRAMDKAVKHVQNKMQDYPAQKPTKTGYRRTGTLGRRWTTKVNGDGSEGVVGNNVEYAPYVQGHSQKEQAQEMQRRDWKGADVIAKQEEATIKRLFEDELTRELGR